MKSKTFLFLMLGLVSSVTIGVQEWTKLSVQAQTELPGFEAQSSAPPLPSPPTVRKSRVAYANYKGKSINLTSSWEGAKACVVESAKINCFDSYAQANSFTRSSDSLQTNSLSASACGTWTYVYQYTNFRGRRLQFRDSGYWQDYATYGFRNRQSSWSNPRCKGVWLYDIGTGQYYYEGPNARSASMGAWDNRADYIYLY